MKSQSGGTFLGLILGLVVGLGLALAVAVYVTKVPLPFMNKGQSRTADQDAAEEKKNKDWDPNAPLYGKNPAKPSAASKSGEDAVPNADKSDAASAKAESKPAVTADPLGDLARSKSAEKSADPFNYFVQVGAFRTIEDAESQRAKLSLAGIDAKVSEREQSGRVVFRVRVGPFDRREDAEKSKDRLDASGYETSLVRVQR
ncbi:MAG: sporulation protein [Betaproteobacteria bacterium]|nr:sporulation protein [Betaproteobacteria bacterium]